MSEAFAIPAAKPAWPARIWNHPFIRAIVGIVLTFVPMPLVMILAHNLVAKPYRIVWPQLLAAALSYLAYRFFVRRIEKREMREFSKPGALRESAGGLLLGAVLVGSVFALLGMFGVYHLEGLNEVGVSLLHPLAELLLVGLSEELVFRGVVFGIAERSLGSRWAVLISALIFGLGHIPNEGISLLAVASVTAFGFLQAAIYLRTRKLWMCITNHIAWNFCVGQIFSTTVSGHGPEAGLLRGQLSGSEMMTGGAFGVEGSLITVLVIGLVAAWLLYRAPLKPRASASQASAA